MFIVGLLELGTRRVHTSSGFALIDLFITSFLLHAAQCLLGFFMTSNVTAESPNCGGSDNDAGNDTRIGSCLVHGLILYSILIVVAAPICLSLSACGAGLSLPSCGGQCHHEIGGQPKQGLRGESR